MPLVGNEITANDVAADPDENIKPQDVTTKILGEYTLKQKVKYDLEATKVINGIKEEYGDGVSSLIRIYNASGCTLTYSKQGPDWHGHMWKYPPEQTILNGQWAVFLHVKTSGAATGSESCVVYSINNEAVDLLCGWMSPWDHDLYSPTVLIKGAKIGEWPTRESWDKVESAINHSGSHSVSLFEGNPDSFKGVAVIGDNTSPMVNYTITTE